MVEQLIAAKTKMETANNFGHGLSLSGLGEGHGDGVVLRRKLSTGETMLIVVEAYLSYLHSQDLFCAGIWSIDEYRYNS